MTKLRLGLALGLALALVACKGKKADTTPKNMGGDSGAKIDASLCESSGKREATYDLNKDGKPDIWRLYKGDTLTCKQIDFDHDGKKDWLVAYDPAGHILYQKADFDFDGKFDIKEIYGPDGQLTSVRRDRNGDNLPDQWDQYVDGVLTATTYDDNFDGKVDRREDASTNGQKAPETPLTPAPPPPGAGSGSGSGSGASSGSASASK